MNDRANDQLEPTLNGRRIAFVGKLASMSRRDAERVIRDSGGLVVERDDRQVNLIVVGDDDADLARSSDSRTLLPADAQERLSSGEIELIDESELWSLTGLVESGQGIERLYTPAMLAELVRVPIAAVRQWHRSGALQAKREVRRLPYFDFEEARVARKLAALIEAGCSLGVVGRKLEELKRLLPSSSRPLAEPSVVVEGRRVYVRRDEGLSEPWGQLLIDFDSDKATQAEDAEEHVVAIPFATADVLRKGSLTQTPSTHLMAVEELRTLAAELEGNGHPQQAVEVYRSILFSGNAVADDHFALAEVLYLSGDLSAARERYYTAIELDEDFVEARSNLGCILAAQGDLGLAEAAFRGALEYHPDYADAHYHLAKLLDRANRPTEAAGHWHLFMNLAPASPWADEARARLAADK